MSVNTNHIKMLFVIVVIMPSTLFSTDPYTVFPHLDASNLSIFWVLPFAGLLLSIAIFPLLAPHFWHHNFGKVSLFWALSLIIPFYFSQGLKITLYELLHVGLLDYIPFIILLVALFTISGGIHLKGSLIGTPTLNTILILIGTALASWMGTTGAAMLLIRPLIRANAQRKYKVHVIVFFIFLVANIGGSLTPLGDPPLFLGFLKGVDFFWATKALFLPMLFMVICLIIIFFGLDTYFYGKEEIPQPQNQQPERLGLEGKSNLLLLMGVFGSVLLSGFWKPGVQFEIYHVHIDLQHLVRDALLLALAFTSWKITPESIRKVNEYTWFPIIEVGKLFAGIFVTIIPAIAILKAGTHGALAAVISSISTPEGEPVNYMYFWLTGLLSSFLDNAPTYLVFFNIAGGDPLRLMGEMSNTLLAISAGAVFMGANTYIGNAPNFMVKSIAESSGIAMPSFFGYLLKYSIPILFPLYLIIVYLFLV